MEGGTDQIHLTRDELEAIFEAAVETGEEQEWKKVQLKVQTLSGRLRNDKTIKGPFRAFIEFLKPSLGNFYDLDEEGATVIAQRVGYQVSPRRIRDLWHYFKEFQAARMFAGPLSGDPAPQGNLSPGQTLGESRHLDRLLSVVETIRECLYNPQLELMPYDWDERQLSLGGHDWCLIPDQWVYAVTPDFDDEKLWGPGFGSLKAHLHDSPFWRHLDELHQMADQLSRDLDTGAQTLGEKHPRFQFAWDNLQSKLEWCTQISRTPWTPGVDWSEIKMPYGDGYAQKVYLALKGDSLPELHARCWELLIKLQELNQDLDPDTVERLLLSNRCGDCFDA